MGRWISDDGLFYWDGAAWRPLGASAQPGAPPPMVGPVYGPPAAPRGRSPWPAILIGCGFIGVVLILLVIVFVVFAFNSAASARVTRTTT
jgi:hypothetical protein